MTLVPRTRRAANAAMLTQTFAAAAAVALALLSTPPGFSQDTRTIKVGDTTISYRPELEPQARQLAKVWEQVITPRQAGIKRLRSALLDPATAREIAILVGAPSEIEDVQTVLDRMVSIAAEVAWRALSDVRLLRESDVKSAGGIREGPVELAYDATADQFHLGRTVISKEDAERVHSIVLVRDSGAFRTNGQELGAFLAYDFEWNAKLVLAIVHEAAEDPLVNRLGFRCRWFDEGAANWVLLRVVHRIAPDMEEACRASSLPADDIASLKSKADLDRWAMARRDEAGAPVRDLNLERTRYRFATELVSRIVEGQPEGTLAAIVSVLTTTTLYPDNEAVCKAVKALTGKDAKRLLLEYSSHSDGNG